MPTQKESLDYLGEFLMKCHRDQTLFTLETAFKGGWKVESFQGFQDVLKSLSSEQQKKLFDGSVNRIPYVECSPGGPNAPQAEVCKDKNIQSYPTWIIDGQRYTGVQPLDALAQLSHFQYQGEKR